jgi:hypothetical protein
MKQWLCGFALRLNRNYWQKMWIKSWNLHWKFSLLVWTVHIYGQIVVKLPVIVLHKMSDNNSFYIVCNFCELEPYAWNFGWTMTKLLVFNRIVNLKKPKKCLGFTLLLPNITSHLNATKESGWIPYYHFTWCMLK